jgi:hypothetical protein
MSVTFGRSIPFFIECNIRMHFHPAERIEASNFEKMYPEVCDYRQASSNIQMGVRIAQIKLELELQKPGYSTVNLREILTHETVLESRDTMAAIKKVVEESARLSLIDFVKDQYPKLKEKTRYFKTELKLCDEQCKFEGAIFYLADLRSPYDE